jgi:hypothetical protein
MAAVHVRDCRTLYELTVTTAKVWSMQRVHEGIAGLRTGSSWRVRGCTG